MVFQYGTWFGRATGVRRVLAFLAFALLGQPRDALAHHMIGGDLPQNFLEGFLSGLAHPIIGFDHFAFILATWLIAAKVAHGATLPLIFLGASMAGCVVHLAGLAVTGAGIIVAISVVGVGAFLPSLNGSLQFNGSSSTRLTGEDDFGRPRRLDSPLTFRSSSASQGLSSQLTLFDGLQNLNNLRAARASADAAGARVEVQAVSVGGRPQ